ncbi:RB-associated KRAB zinc finger protein isoform X3 [Peromyscus leucopus]|uniref:RB-associated KRAB zinc finger protein isoform X3 n=1 Tax=Peromyscus leucopus TaxID=10041 RepID=UPI001884B006|nr:RB-associated KRAB zinc finger protein isoform X3 [Peromyscus leucopus]
MPRREDFWETEFLRSSWGERRALEPRLPARCCTCASRPMRVPVPAHRLCAALAPCWSLVEANFPPAAFAIAKLESLSPWGRGQSFPVCSRQAQLCGLGRPSWSASRRPRAGRTGAAGPSAWSAISSVCTFPRAAENEPVKGPHVAQAGLQNAVVA